MDIDKRDRFVLVLTPDEICEDNSPSVYIKLQMKETPFRDKRKTKKNPDSLSDLAKLIHYYTQTPNCGLSVDNIVPRTGAKKAVNALVDHESPIYTLRAKSIEPLLEIFTQLSDQVSFLIGHDKAYNRTDFLQMGANYYTKEILEEYFNDALQESEEHCKARQKKGRDEDKLFTLQFNQRHEELYLEHDVNEATIRLSITNRGKNKLLSDPDILEVIKEFFESKKKLLISQKPEDILSSKTNIIAGFVNAEEGRVAFYTNSPEYVDEFLNLEIERGGEKEKIFGENALFIIESHKINKEKLIDYAIPLAQEQFMISREIIPPKKEPISREL
jgi:hypothetical protein